MAHNSLAYFVLVSPVNDMVGAASGGIQTLFDFTKTEKLSDWTEHSDTAKPTGMSKAVLVIQKSQLFQRAIFFSLFVPRASGAGFAAIRLENNFDLRDYHYIALKCRGQGVNFKYKMVLRHKGQNKDTAVFGQVFKVPDNEFVTIRLPLEDFKPYFRGLPLPVEMHPLDLSSVTNITIKVDSGPYLPENQPGVSALEIEWIKAVK